MNPFLSLARRAEQEEEMDAADLSDDRYARVLKHLARINTLTLASRPTIAFVRTLLARRRADAPPLKLLDVGFGHGDMLRAIAQLGGRLNRRVELVGIDLNRRSAAIANIATPADMPIRWLTGDYLDLAGQGWDAIISSLVAHHMHDDGRHMFLRFMEEEARAGWLINDLHRRRLPYIGYPALAMLAGVDPIVRRDGQLSIARSFREHEWRNALSSAGIAGGRICRWFPWRLVVEHVK